MAAFADLVRFIPTLGGTTDFVYSSTVGGCQSPSQANVLNGVSYKLYAVSNDLTQWEVFQGAYNSGSGTFPRTAVLYNSSATGTAAGQSGAGTKINFSTAPQVSIVALAEDLGGFTITPQGRLTLTSGVAAMQSSVAAASTIYYTPAAGSQVPLYNGATFSITSFSEISQSTTDTTKNPAAIGVSKVNDWFVWNDAGTIRLSHGPDWTSDTARSAGTALVLVNGVLLNNASITNGPAASRGTYVGTTRSNGTSTLDFIFGAAASGGTASFMNVWNAYNQVLFSTKVSDSTTSYTYATATVRPVNNSTGNQVSFVSGLANQGFNATLQMHVGSPATAGVFAAIGFALDSAAGMDKINILENPTAAIGIALLNASGSYPGQLGYHFIQANEYVSSGTFTFTGGVDAISGSQDMILDVALWA